MAEDFIDSTPGDLRTLVAGMLGSAEAVQSLDDAGMRTLSTVLLERLMFARQAGITYHGARDLYEVLGYDRILTYRKYRARYARGGLAKRIVDAYPVAVWRGGAELWEDEDPKVSTPLETTWKALDQRLGIWGRFQRAHTLALLSTYSVLLIGAPGDLGDELPRGNPDKLLYLTPFSGGGGPGGDQIMRSMAMDADCVIMTFDVDPQSPRFGLPDTYQLKRTDLSSPLLQRPVHWSRVIHIAHGLLGDEVYGTPGLEAVWNLLDDLDKVTGGGAEAFWLRANAGLHIDFDKTMGMPAKPGQQPVAGLSPEQRKSFEEKAEKLQHQLDRVMVTRGATVTQLSSATASFKDPADAIVTQIAGAMAIPKRILVGSEMGQLASGQDKDNWNTQVQDQRTSWAFPCLVKPFVDRLVQYGYLPPPKVADTFFIEWPVIEDLTEDEKVKMQLDMVNVNKTQDAVVYTEDEIREVRGLGPIGTMAESAGLSEEQKASIAMKLAMTNKDMGITVFTGAEIRRITYGFEPLLPSEEVPIGMPEKISVGAPPALGTDSSQQVAQPTQPLGTGKNAGLLPGDTAVTAAPLAAQLAALEQAIEDNDAATILKIVGIDA